jgi:glycosyltransferase involved in cell wall biosynthesis
MSGRPVVSVVVPTRGRPGALKRCLESLMRQDYPIDAFEIVVIDDGSPQQVALPEFDSGASVTLRRQPQGGPAAARNHGLEQARGEYVAFIDDDCEAPPDWLRELLGTLQRHPGAGAGGPVANDLAGNPFSEASQALVSFLCEYYNANPDDARFFTSNNLAFPRAALMEAGGFDAQYQRAAAEDRELCDRWRRQGRRLVTAPAALVRHSHNLTLPAFWRQHFSYGTGAWHYWQHRANGQSSRVKVEPLGFYGSLLTWPVRTHGVAGLPVGALLALAQVANAAGFFSEAMRRR